MIAGVVSLAFWLGVMYVCLKIISYYWNQLQTSWLQERTDQMVKALRTTAAAMEPHLKHPDAKGGGLKICCCHLSGEFIVATQDEMCEACDCSMEFNAHNVNGALDHMRQEIAKRDQTITRMEEDRADERQEID